jgi:hypothetical protein
VAIKEKLVANFLISIKKKINKLTFFTNSKNTYPGDQLITHTAGSGSGALLYLITLHSFLTLSCTDKAVVEKPHPLSDKERRMIVNILHHDLQGPERSNLIKATFPLMLQKGVGIHCLQSVFNRKKLFYALECLS